MSDPNEIPQEQESNLTEKNSIDNESVVDNVEEIAAVEDANQPTAEKTVDTVDTFQEIDEAEKSETANDTTSDAPEAVNPETTEAEEEQDEDEISSSDDEDMEDISEEDTPGYHNMSQKELVAAFKTLLQSGKIQIIKKQVEEIKAEFNSSFDEEYKEKKKEFLASGGNYVDFHYTTPLKSEFDSLFFEYKESRNNYYKKLKKDLQANLQKRLDLIEELKGLITVEEDLNTTFKQFRDIQERWKEAGPIPRDGYNTVWNNYHHHVEIFYDFVHLNKEFRDRDFKYNLEEKMKIISRTEELANEPDIHKAFRELQMLHKMWKEETGPVEKSQREQIWERFSEATKVIHDKKAEHQKKLEKDFEANLQKKQEIIAAIAALSENAENTHAMWQEKIAELEKLRNAFIKTGKVPQKDNENTWLAFKEAVRLFNRNKNKFYKDQKKEQFENLRKKRELIKIAEEHKNSTDFETITPVMKKIQEDWKNIGHVPRRESDKIWKEFKSACNHYFERLHQERNQYKKEEEEALAKKTSLLEVIQQMNDSEEKPNIDEIKEKISQWKEIGKVPFARKSIDNKFNRLIDSLFKKLDISKKESELLKYENKLNSINPGDEKKVQNELFYITKKMEEIKQSINQQENNLGFFQHVDDNNPMLREVHKSIRKLKDDLDLLQAKYQKLKEHF